MYRRAGNLSRDSISADNEKEKYDKAKKSANIVKAINKSEELRTEAKVDKKTPEYKRATVRDKRYGNPYGSLELGGGIRKDRRADHEARRGVKKEEVEIVDERAELKRLNYGNAVVPQKKTQEQTTKPKKPIPTGGDGTAYVGEAKKAKKDYDGDGKVESGTQEFLGSRDKAIKKAIAKRRGRYNEGFSSWRIDLDFNESVKSKGGLVSSKSPNCIVMPDKDGDDEKKSTKSVVTKRQKQLMGEEGYDIARDMGRVRPSKDKKDATTMPPSKEMKKTQKVNKGPSAFERVKAKYGKSVMNVGKKKLTKNST